ncbi:MAG TPA: aldo/keto reductase [Planctomycetota bacterium]|nr:aldo/keto reductase [Planctomycetota bacterium]
MDLRPFGDPGRRVPALGLGTWNLEHDDRASAIAALRRGIDLGLTHVDTAEMYGSGRVEAIVGEALRGIRDRVFLVSKVLPSNATYDGTLRACERSLAQLATDRLDCYLLHWPSSHPLEGTIRAFEKLAKDGKIRSYGVSNFDVAGLEEAVRLAGKGRIACNQVLYHLGERTVEHQVLPWCQKRGIPIVAYSPLGARRFPSGPVLEEIAGARKATPRQIALAFLIRRESVFAIPKTSSVRHVEENAAALQIALSEDEVRRLDSAFPPGPWRGLATA